MHFLQGSKVRDEKYNEEVTKKLEKCHLESGAESIRNKKRKGPRSKYLQQKTPSALSYKDECYSAIDHFFEHDYSCPSFKYFSN